MKINKKTIQIIILILIILGVGYYFFNEFYSDKKNSDNNYYVDNNYKIEQASLEEIFEFKIFNENLNEEQINKYKEKFDNLVKQVKTFEKDKISLSVLNSLGQIKNILHDFDGARKVWEYACIINPKNSISFFNLGTLYSENLKDNEKAEINFMKALQNSAGEKANEQYYRGVVNFYTYFYTEKKQQIEKILLQGLETEQYKNNQDLLALLATYYGNNNQKQKAIEYWGKVLEIDPNNKAVINEIEKLK